MATKSKSTGKSSRQARLKATARTRSASKTIRCKVNRLPVTSMLYALLYIVDKADPDKRQASGMAEAMESIKVLKAVNSRLRDNGSMEGAELHDIIDATASSYVNLYYSLNRNMTESILKERHGRIPKEQNILTMPALMMVMNVPKSGAVSAIRTGLYKKPFAFLQSAIATSRKMETLRASMALKKSIDFTAERLSYSLQTVEKLMDGIDAGNIRPNEDEAVKARVIDDLVRLSERYDAHTVTYINSKLDEASFNISTAQRIVRQ